MRKIALLHTVLPVAASFEGELRAALAMEVKVYNVWDQFLSLDPNDVGVFTRAHQRRLLHDLERCAETGAELVTFDGCPIAHLVLAQRLAVERALARGLNPDTPRNLTRSVILP